MEAREEAWTTPMLMGSLVEAEGDVAAMLNMGYAL